MIPWHLVWSLLGLLGLVLGTWTVLSVRQILAPTRRVVPPPDPLPAYQEHSVPGPDGQPLEVWVLEPDRAPAATVLGVHGYYANRHQLLGLAGRLCARGYEVLLMELRGHGTRRPPCTLGRREAGDAGAIVAWARARANRHDVPVAVLGWSMGAAVACQIAAREPLVRAVIADSMYSRFRPIVARSILRRFRLRPVPWVWLTWSGLGVALGCRPSALDPASVAARVRQPLLLIQGGADSVVAPANREEAYARWAGPKERWVEPLVAHVKMFAQDPDRYVERVVGFLERVLAA